MSVTINSVSVINSKSSIGNVLLLDEFPNASIAYSFRRLNTFYRGPAIKVRRSSDNAEQDIGFTGLNLDETSLVSFVGVSGNGYISKWYDQSGNNNDATASTNNQPRLVFNGAINKFNNRIYADFPDQAGMNFTNVSSTSDWSCFFVAKRTGQSVKLWALSTSSGTAANRVYALAHYSDNNIYIRNRPNYYVIADNTSSQYIYSSFSVGNPLYLFMNGISKSITLGGSSATTSDFNTLGYSVSPEYSSGYIYETVFYKLDKRTDRSLIELNINKYYNIY